MVFYCSGKGCGVDMEYIVDGGWKWSTYVRVIAQDINVFIGACTVLNDTLAWDLTGNCDPSECLDIDPITLY